MASPQLPPTQNLLQNRLKPQANIPAVESNIRKNVAQSAYANIASSSAQLIRETNEARVYLDRIRDTLKSDQSCMDNIIALFDEIKTIASTADSRQGVAAVDRGTEVKNEIRATESAPSTSTPSIPHEQPIIAQPHSPVSEEHMEVDSTEIVRLTEKMEELMREVDVEQTDKQNLLAQIESLRNEATKQSQLLTNTTADHNIALSDVNRLQEEKNNLEAQVESLKKDVETTKQAHLLDDSVMQLGSAVLLQLKELKQELGDEGQINSDVEDTLMTSSDPSEFA